MWAVASAYLIHDLLCARLKCYGPNVVLLHSGVPVWLYHLPVWGFSWCFWNASRCITYCVQVASTYKRPSVSHEELQESALCKYMARHVWVIKSMDAVTAVDHWSRCRHHLRLQLPLPLSLIHLGNSHPEWICSDRAGFWFRDGGRQVFNSAERSGSDTNAASGAGYNATQWGFSGRCCAMTDFTRRGGWSIYLPSLCSGRGGSHVCIDICNARFVQPRCGGSVPNLDCRGYGTPSLRGIPLSSRYGNVSLTTQRLRIPRRPLLLLILTNSKTWNILYDQICVRARALGRHSPI